MKNITKIRAIRNSRNMRMIELASRAKIHQSRISILENGYFPPTEKELEKIAQVLGCDVADLVDEQSEN